MAEIHICTAVKYSAADAVNHQGQSHRILYLHDPLGDHEDEILKEKMFSFKLDVEYE